MENTRISITQGEWQRVYQDIAPFTQDDEQRASGHVLFTAKGGARSWVATDGKCLAVLECDGAPGPDVELLISPRLVSAACALSQAADESVDLVVDADRPGVVSASADCGSVTLPVFVGDVPAWHDGLAIARARASSTAVVARDAIWSVMAEARRAPQGIDLEAVNPPFWLASEPGVVTATVEWPRIGPSLFVVPVAGGSSARVCVNPRRLVNLVSSAAPGDITLALPDAPDGPVLVSDDTGWSGFLMAVDRVEEELRPALEATLTDAFGDIPLVRDEDGDYVLPFGTVPVYARLAGGDSHRVQVFSVAVTDIRTSRKLLGELNDQNCRIPFAKALWFASQVLFETEHEIDQLDPESLIESCSRVAELASRLGPLLAMAFGGQATAADTP
jgi:hypothetical protein